MGRRPRRKRPWPARSVASAPGPGCAGSPRTHTAGVPLSRGAGFMVTGRLRQRSWETPEGEKRSVAEIEADEVGASLKFATAKVERANDRAASDRNQGRERQAERGGDFNDGPPF